MFAALPRLYEMHSATVVGSFLAVHVQFLVELMATHRTSPHWFAMEFHLPITFTNFIIHFIDEISSINFIDGMMKLRGEVETHRPLHFLL